MKPIIETRDLTIRFGSLIANDRLNISIEPGKIHAIAGENGAGTVSYTHLRCRRS